MELKTSLKILLIVVALILFFRFVRKKEIEENKSHEPDNGNGGKHPTDPLPEEQQEGQSDIWGVNKNTLQKSEMISDSFKTK